VVTRPPRRTTHTILAISRTIRLILSSTDFFLPKTPICTTPQCFLEESAAETPNTKIEADQAKIGGGNSIGATAEGISTFSNVFYILTMMKGD
jgi:hypothetical protein